MSSWRDFESVNMLVLGNLKSIHFSEHPLPVSVLQLPFVLQMHFSLNQA